jgi:hypothetical protein
MQMYTSYGLWGINYNMMLSLNKSLNKIPLWCVRCKISLVKVVCINVENKVEHIMKLTF